MGTLRSEESKVRVLIVPDPDPLPPDPVAVAYFASLDARLTAPPVELAPVEVCAPDGLEESPPEVVPRASGADDGDREEYRVELNEIIFRLMDARGLAEDATPDAEVERVAVDELGTFEGWVRRRRREPELIEYAPGKYM
jgi:hypothetical protein